jgi:hypothetical protein
MVRRYEQDPSSRLEHGKTSQEQGKIVPHNGFDSPTRELIFSRLVSG